MKKIINISIILLGLLVLSISNVHAEEKDNLFVTDQVLDDGFLEEIEDEEIILYGTQVSINWSIDPKIQKKTKSFTKKAGEEISVNLKVSSNKKIRVGVIQDGTVKKYYETSTVINKKFPVTKKGSYSVFIQNMSSSTVKVIGSYIK